jgi:MoaA/NifB/PqqE/SkfB family radical SAM enzyme
MARHPAELTTAEGRRLLGDLAGAFPGAVVILTGGEPLTRPDVLELAASGTAVGLQVALSVDVGRLLTQELCTAIREAGVRRVSFSLHFPDAERCDRFASTPGFYEGALSGLANLRAAGIPFQLHTTVMRSNALLLPQMHDLVGSLGAVGGSSSSCPDRSWTASRRRELDPSSTSRAAGSTACNGSPRSLSSRSALRTSAGSRCSRRACAESDDPSV